MANVQPCETHDNFFISNGLKKALAGVLLAAFSTVAVPAPKEIIADPAAHELYDLRTIRLDTGIDPKTASAVNQKLQLLDDISHDDITLIINSPGGEVDSGFAIINKMKSIKSKVATVCEGQAASMGAIILAMGEKGKRSSTPDCNIMFHQLSVELGGKASDVLSDADSIRRTRDRMNEALSEASGLPAQKINTMLISNNYMPPKDALKLHFIDSVIYPNGVNASDSAPAKDQKPLGMPFTPFGMNNVAP